jgi:hypothetical protein
MSTPHGYDVYNIEQPYFISRGLWSLTGTESAPAFMLLKRTSTLSSGLWGVSGVHHVRLNAQVYDDISGITGCIGCTIEEILKDSDTGSTNINKVFARRNMSVLHIGVVRIPQVSGTLDGTPVTLTWGDRVAPSISGFRAWEWVNTDAAGSGFVTTGTAQQVLGLYMDRPSNMTGTSGAAWRRIFMCPEAVYGVHK